MRLVLSSLPRMMIMAAVVDSALFVPLGGLLALLAFVLFGVSLQSFMTFGGLLNPVEGLIAWWAMLLVPSLVYAAYMMPWQSK